MKIAVPRETAEGEARVALTPQSAAQLIADGNQVLVEKRTNLTGDFINLVGFDSDEALVKIDMSEFGERHNTSRLLGAPAGYVGYDDGGQLTDKIRRQPYSVVLFDEIEKASDALWQLLLGILDKATLTLGDNRRVDLSQCIIIMTSNLGAGEMSSLVDGGTKWSDAGLNLCFESSAGQINNRCLIVESQGHDSVISGSIVRCRHRNSAHGVFAEVTHDDFGGIAFWRDKADARNPFSVLSSRHLSAHQDRTVRRVERNRLHAWVSSCMAKLEDLVGSPVQFVDQGAFS